MRKNIFAIMATAALIGCGSTLKTEGPKKVDDLVGSIEQVYVESELCREKATVAMDKLQVIAAAEFKEGDAAAAYAEFVQALDESMKQAEVMMATIDPMKAAADPIFDTWEADMKQYSSESMRERSTERLEKTRERFDSIVRNAEATQEKYEVLNKGMQDHALFLHNDLNADALTVIQEDVRDLVLLVAEIDEGYELTMKSARSYIDTTALPLSSAAQRYEDRVEASRERDEEDGKEPKVRRVSARGSAR